MQLGRRRRSSGFGISSPTSPGYESANALTAAGFRVRKQDTDTMRRLIQPWQARSFAYYDLVPEIKYAGQFYSRMLSPLRLYAGELDEKGDWVETTNEVAIAALERIQDPGGGRTGLLSSYGRLMFLAGECYLLVTQDEDTGEEQWEMLSTDELRIQGGLILRYKAPSLYVEEYREPSDDDWEPLDEKTAIAYRLWKRHPRYSMLADATMQGVLDVCEELVLLTKVIRSRARSRMAGPGVLWIDDRVSPKLPEPGPDEDPSVDVFLAALIEASTSPIVDEGSAAASSPILMRVTVPPDVGMTVKDVAYHMQIVDPTQLYPETGLRMELVNRLAIGLDMPPEMLKGMEDANHWCVDDQTEILTTEGWKRHDAIEIGDTALTLNHETGLSEWQPVEEVARFEVEDLPMLSIESRYHSSLTTLNHRWPVLRLTGRVGRWEREWTYSDELRTTHRLVTAAPSRDALMPQWVQHDDALVELVAWLWTEGQVRERGYGRRAPQVAIYQSHTANPDNVLGIRAALTSLYGAAVAVPMRGGRGAAIEQEPHWREVPRNDGKTTFRLNAAAAARLLAHVSPDRVVSTDFVRTLTASQLALFIEVSTRADGSTMRSGCQIIGQSDAERLAPLELAAILLGRSPSSYSQAHDGFDRHEQHYVSVSDRQTVRLKKAHLREERYTGTIWCPVTENATWCARRNGRVFFTGNTAWQVDEQTWKGHGQPIAQQLVDDLTAAYFRPYLREVEKLSDFRRYAILYDAAAVINHPDRTKDAKDLYDKRAIGKRALRETANFAEEDAPTDDELNEMIGIAVRDGSLALYGIPSKLGTGGVEPQPGEIETGEKGAGGTVTAPAGPTTGAEVEKGPPAGDGSEPVSTVGSIELARILGASELAVLRIREAAGNRLKSLAKRDAELRDLVHDVPPGRVAAVLGPERIKQLGAPERELAASARSLVVDALRMYGLKNDEVVDKIADTIERYAVRTLYAETPPQMPASFVHWVSALTNGK